MAIPSFVQSILPSGTFQEDENLYFPCVDISEFNGSYVTPPTATETHELTVVEGQNVHKAEILGPNPVIEGQNTNHRAYPTIQMKQWNKPTGVLPYALLDFNLYMDFDLTGGENANWISLLTFSSYRDDNWQKSLLVNVDSNGGLHFMHVNGQGNSHPQPNETRLQIPMKQITRLTLLVAYSEIPGITFNAPVAALWVDGNYYTQVEFTNRLPVEVEQQYNLEFVDGMDQIHLGLYAPPLLGSGYILNNEINLSALSYLP